jgi:ABC-type dipeptide/oligopeptide/nickel transport system ATPase component
MIYITHDLMIALKVADRIAVMDRRKDHRDWKLA